MESTTGKTDIYLGRGDPVQEAASMGRQAD